MGENIQIDWNTLALPEWQERFSTIPQSNILQSYAYARAHCKYARQRARWGLIKIDGREAGLIQIFEAGFLWNAVHAVMIDRGPLWFPGFGNAMHVKRVFEELNRQFPKRFGRKRRILPEVEDGPSIQKMLGQYGLERQAQEPYQTYWLGLEKDEETLRAHLQQKWRGHLNRAERQNLKIEWDFDGRHAPWMTGIYAADKAARGYAGITPAFLKTYIPVLLESNDFCLGRAMMGDNPEAFVLIVKHGRSATYLAGWNGEAGRAAGAHHLLLWDGVKMLKQHGIKELDLGGVNDDSAEGIKVFKEGLGGRFVRYVGMYA